RLPIRRPCMSVNATTTVSISPRSTSPLSSSMLSIASILAVLTPSRQAALNRPHFSGANEGGRMSTSAGVERRPHDEDEALLHKLGYAQELFRSMGGFSNFAISFTIISILAGSLILYDYGLAWAGTAASLIGWPLVTIFVLCIAASMAEVASAYPTAGGLYYW